MTTYRWKNLIRGLGLGTAFVCGAAVAATTAPSSAPAAAPSILHHTRALPSPPAMYFDLDEVLSEPGAEREQEAGLWTAGSVVNGGSPHRLIHFTFDDGPSRWTTPGLLNELDRLGIKATFFVTTARMQSLGDRARVERELLADIARRGHQIGNHTVSHEQLPLLSAADAAEEVLEAEQLIRDVTGTRPVFMRPPGGSRSPRIDAMLARAGYTQVLWNLGSGDFQVRTSEEVVRTFRRVLARRERENGELGGIILLHDTHAWSVAAVPQIVALLEARNCELLSEGEELFDVVDDPSAFFVPQNLEGQNRIEAMARVEDRIRVRQETLRVQTELRCTTVASRK